MSCFVSCSNLRTSRWLSSSAELRVLWLPTEGIWVGTIIYRVEGCFFFELGTLQTEGPYEDSFSLGCKRWFSLHSPYTVSNLICCLLSTRLGRC
jgi:hypothetical protein